MSYIIRNKLTKDIIRYSSTPLRTDGKLPSDLDPTVEVLVEVREEQPSYNSNIEKLVPLVREESGADDEPIHMIHGWEVVPLTAEELAEVEKTEADKTERQVVKALMADIKAGTGTNGEKITRLEKAVHRLLKDLLH